LRIAASICSAPRPFARLLANCRVDLLLHRGPVGIDLDGIDLDLRHLDVLFVRLRDDGAAGERRCHHGCAKNQKLPCVHRLLLTGAPSFISFPLVDFED